MISQVLRHFRIIPGFTTGNHRKVCECYDSDTRPDNKGISQISEHELYFKTQFCSQNVTQHSLPATLRCNTKIARLPQLARSFRRTTPSDHTSTGGPSYALALQIAAHCGQFLVSVSYSSHSQVCDNSPVAEAQHLRVKAIATMSCYLSKECSQ
eukprot:2607199-Amphidinium_carterae.2